MIKQHSKKNKASFLVLPMLGPDQDYFDWSGLFINCYVQDANYPEYNNHIVLLYKYPEVLSANNIQQILRMEEKLFRNLDSDMVFRYEPDTEHSVFIFEVPKKYQEDYDWFMYGKYSKMSPGYKNKILSFHTESSSKGIIGVLTRDKTMLKNLHKNLGCMKQQCKCNSSNYEDCKSFNSYEFDFSKAEVWDKVGEEEILTIDIKKHKRIKMK
jgi:hypothetical protein